MATIQPIEARSVHQIQSGQVIVDLCSVVKELVENSLDAGTTSLDIRFKNYGLESIEVQDNGCGIAPDDFETIALKHYTSKLSTYDDLASLQTFGFRGEALSSLCALSNFHIVTATASDGPKGTRLDFESSGKVKTKSVVASTKGTIVAVENIFKNLPVRRKELEKNIKREYAKVLGLLHAYTCISTGVRFTVSNHPAKGKKVIAFQTKANPTTRENISNVYGAKTMLALLPLDLKLVMNPTAASTQSAKAWATQDDASERDIRLLGHISRPVVGEGRQTPDRQMFFVNSRPCALPQVAKAINDVYKGYNITQSPFIFANLKMDTNAYDVNVSPDKRTILLHDQTALLEALKVSLIDLFESHDQSVPQATPLGNRKLPAFKPPSVMREQSTGGEVTAQFKSPLVSNLPSIPAVPSQPEPASSATTSSSEPANLDGGVLRPFLTRDTEDRDSVDRANIAAAAAKRRRQMAQNGSQREDPQGPARVDVMGPPEKPRSVTSHNLPRPVQDFNARLDIAAQEPQKLLTSFVRASDIIHDTELIAPPLPKTPRRKERPDEGSDAEGSIPSILNTSKKLTSGVVPNAFDRMRPMRTPQETATVTIGNQRTMTTLGTPEAKRRRIHTPKFDLDGRKPTQPSPLFVRSMRSFSAPGTRMEAESSQDQIDEEEQRQALEAISGDSRRSISTSSMTAMTEDSEMLDLDDGPEVPPATPALFLASDDVSDGEYMDEAEKKARDKARVERMIALAEEAAARPSSDHLKRAKSVLTNRRVKKDSTLKILQKISYPVARIEKILSSITKAMQAHDATALALERARPDGTQATNGEERLSLTVSKSDFKGMRIVGQFNLGFILAMRLAAPSVGRKGKCQPVNSRCNDELFIIDQHASDEKYNFERFQTETIIQNQPLVHPRLLELTAIEEEIIQNFKDVLHKNGFKIEIDLSGDTSVGQRCRLVSLPMSREVVFDAHDLEELIALLNEGAGIHARPSKVRKMFAMRACRISIMVGKALTQQQMQKVVRHMGEIDKPWNCPHGRPTMRHLYSMDQWSGWKEGDGVQGLGEKTKKTDWAAYVKKGKMSGALSKASKEKAKDDGKKWLFIQSQEVSSRFQECKAT
ncbi:dna mismatch repair protein [Venturia nashicola]|uniref:DNA mismatch repair protein PMS1 n=1 Tax=Venturia nashicola TaxID=86259 RepID=A0A4Z1PDG7_9PEZI|nr:dna mismatch repair protein [Venturia nashicola]